MVFLFTALFAWYNIYMEPDWNEDTDSPLTDWEDIDDIPDFDQMDDPYEEI